MIVFKYLSHSFQCCPNDSISCNISANLNSNTSQYLGIVRIISQFRSIFPFHFPLSFKQFLVCVFEIFVLEKLNIRQIKSLFKQIIKNGTNLNPLINSKVQKHKQTKILTFSSRERFDGSLSSLECFLGVTSLFLGVTSLVLGLKLLSLTFPSSKYKYQSIIN